MLDAQGHPTAPTQVWGLQSPCRKRPILRASRASAAGGPPSPAKVGGGACHSGAGGIRLWVCGDIHPNSGLLRTAATNHLSIRLHAAQVALWDADIIFLRVHKSYQGGGGVYAPLFF